MYITTTLIKNKDEYLEHMSDITFRLWRFVLLDNEITWKVNCGGLWINTNQEYMERTYQQMKREQKIKRIIS